MNTTDPILAAIREQKRTIELAFQADIRRLEVVEQVYLNGGSEQEGRVPVKHGLSADEESAVIEYVRLHPRVRALDVAEKLNVSASTLRRFFAFDERFIQTNIGSRNRRYELRHDEPALKLDETKLDKEYTKVEDKPKPTPKQHHPKPAPKSNGTKVEANTEKVDVLRTNINTPTKEIKGASAGTPGTPQGQTAKEYYAQTRLRVLNWISLHLKEDKAFMVKQVAAALNIGLSSATNHLNDLCDAEVLTNLGRARKEDLPEGWMGQRPILYRKFRNTDRKDYPTTIVPGQEVHMRDLANDGV